FSQEKSSKIHAQGSKKSAFSVHVSQLGF
ncbi:acetyltransferase, putative, partial [Vibrio cholerae O1 str. Nep-21106]